MPTEGALNIHEGELHSSPGELVRKSHCHIVRLNSDNMKVLLLALLVAIQFVKCGAEAGTKVRRWS